MRFMLSQEKSACVCTAWCSSWVVDAVSHVIMSDIVFLWCRKERHRERQRWIPPRRCDVPLGQSEGATRIFYNRRALGGLGPPLNDPSFDRPDIVMRQMSNVSFAEFAVRHTQQVQTDAVLHSVLRFGTRTSFRHRQTPPVAHGFCVNVSFAQSWLQSDIILPLFEPHTQRV